MHAEPMWMRIHNVTCVLETSATPLLWNVIIQPRPKCVFRGGCQPQCATHQTKCACRVGDPNLVKHPLISRISQRNSCHLVPLFLACIFRDFCAIPGFFAHKDFTTGPPGLVFARPHLTTSQVTLTCTCAQRPKMLSSLFYVDIQPHHDVKVQCQPFLHSKTSSDDNHMLLHAGFMRQSNRTWGWHLSCLRDSMLSDADGAFGAVALIRRR